MSYPDWNELKEIAQSIGVNLDSAGIKWVDKLKKGLIEIESAEQLSFGIKNKDSIIAINPENGDIHKVILYIPQIQKERLEMKNGRIPEDCHKYHLFHCQTQALQNFIQGKNEKYRISSTTDGKFEYSILNGTEVHEKYEDLELKICGNCLKIYEKIFQKPRKKFNLEEFFKTNLSNFYKNPTFKFDHDDIPNYYTNNWNDIATKYKKLKDYTCEICRWKPTNKSHEKYINAHHRDGMKYNNNRDNIKILCVSCHAEQDEHGHIKQDPRYNEFLNIRGAH